jgi:hypothetical protein
MPDYRANSWAPTAISFSQKSWTGRRRAAAIAVAKRLVDGMMSSYGLRDRKIAKFECEQDMP